MFGYRFPQVINSVAQNVLALFSYNWIHFLPQSSISTGRKHQVNSVKLVITKSFKVLTWLVQGNKPEIPAPVLGPSFGHFPCSSWKHRKLSDTSHGPLGPSLAVPLSLSCFKFTVARPYWWWGKCIKICARCVVSSLGAWEVRPSFQNSPELMELWSFFPPHSQGIGMGPSGRNAHDFSDFRNIIN